MALTACGFMTPIGWVLFRGSNFGRGNKSRGFCWGQVAILGVANERGEKRGGREQKGSECGCITPFKALTKGHHHLIKMSPSQTSLGPRTGKRTEVRECGSPDLALYEAFRGLVAKG